MFHVRRLLTQSSLSSYKNRLLINIPTFKDNNTNKIFASSYSSIKQDNNIKNFKADSSTVILSDSCIKVKLKIIQLQVLQIYLSNFYYCRD